VSGEYLASLVERSSSGHHSFQTASSKKNKKYMRIKIFILALFFGHIGIAQDGYYGRPSSYPPNEFKTNTAYNFDYKMTGIMTKGSDRIPLTIYINSADGSIGVKDDDMAFMLARSVESRGEKFNFAVIIPDKGTRIYATMNDPEGGHKNVCVTSERSLSAPALQLEFAQAETFHRFMQNATKTPGGNHPVFGQQTLYTGEMNGKTFKVTISKKSAPVKITPAHIGFLCGIFADDNQRKNRYITKFVTPDGVTVEMERFSPTNFIWSASGYEEIMPPSTYNVESITDNQDRLKEIGENMARITRNMDYSNPDAIEMSSLKMMIETQRFNAIKSGHPERQISEANAGSLINRKARIIDKRKECKRLEEMGDKIGKATCRRQLRQMESEYKELYNRYFRH